MARHRRHPALHRRGRGHHHAAPPAPPGAVSLTAPPILVLASASSARARILDGAGVPYRRDPARVDEATIKKDHRDGSAADAALILAEAKARDTAARHPGTWVIGADQILECDGAWFDKPGDKAAAGDHLRRLRGRTHQLHAAVCVVRDGSARWRHVETARLTMRDLDEAAIARYLERSGPEILESVGAYRLEGLGAGLFTVIAGDFFTILGLPLLPLLAFLREAGAIDG